MAQETVHGLPRGQVVPSSIYSAAGTPNSASAPSEIKIKSEDDEIYLIENPTAKADKDEVLKFTEGIKDRMRKYSRRDFANARIQIEKQLFDIEFGSNNSESTQQ